MTQREYTAFSKWCSIIGRLNRIAYWRSKRYATGGVIEPREQLLVCERPDSCQIHLLRNHDPARAIGKALKTGENTYTIRVVNGATIHINIDKPNEPPRIPPHMATGDDAI
jgi:hypothetical protein